SRGGCQRLARRLHPESPCGRRCAASDTVDQPLRGLRPLYGEYHLRSDETPYHFPTARHKNPLSRYSIVTSESSPRLARPLSPIAVTRSPSIEWCRSLLTTVLFLPMIECLIRLSRTSAPRSRVTLGPISLRSILTPSSIRTGSCRVTPGNS